MGAKAEGVLMFKDEKNYKEVLSILEDPENMPREFRRLAARLHAGDQ